MCSYSNVGRPSVDHLCSSRAGKWQLALQTDHGQPGKAARPCHNVLRRPLQPRDEVAPLTVCEPYKVTG